MILLSFDVEEFDMPFEYDRTLPFEEQMAVSETGTRIVLALLAKHEVKATFFCTANFALNAPDTIRKIVSEGHEIASHGYYHSNFKPEHLKQSKEVLEAITGTPVTGYRMARMYPIAVEQVAAAGYSYNTSLNPTYLPGRYNNFSVPRTSFQEKGIWQVPASVTPLFRFPLFWLSFHNLPLNLYKNFCRWTHWQDGYLNLYFHPWEFTDLSDKGKYNLPGYVSKNSGHLMLQRMENLILFFKKEDYAFVTFNEFLNHRELSLINKV